MVNNDWDATIHYAAVSNRVCITTQMECRMKTAVVTDHPGIKL